MPQEDTMNHRTRVARTRRANTRKRLVESAFRVFAKKGVDASVIEDVISQADLSRGTFYNYFQSNEELLVAVHDQLREELIVMIKEAVADCADPAERIALRIGLLFRFARQNPLLAQFVAQIGFKAAGSELLLSGQMGREIQEGIERGRFVNCTPDAALDFVTGGIMVGLLRISMGEVSDAYVGALTVSALRALGLEPLEAETLSSKPLPEMALHAEGTLVFSMLNS